MTECFINFFPLQLFNLKASKYTLPTILAWNIFNYTKKIFDIWIVWWYEKSLNIEEAILENYKSPTAERFVEIIKLSQYVYSIHIHHVLFFEDYIELMRDLSHLKYTIPSIHTYQNNLAWYSKHSSLLLTLVHTITKIHFHQWCIRGKFAKQI